MSCHRATLGSFIEDADVKRLLVYLDGKELGVVSTSAWSRCAAHHNMLQRPSANPAHCGLQTVKPLQKFKRKTVYFVKTSPAKLDNENIKKVVSKAEDACRVYCWAALILRSSCAGDTWRVHRSCA